MAIEHTPEDRQKFSADMKRLAHQQWDPNSGVRERLALLAHFGPQFTGEADWTYNSRGDMWHNLQGVRYAVSQEGSASLAKLEAAGLPRAKAMERIGYPDKA